jgi:hypothetical protein
MRNGLKALLLCAGVAIIWSTTGAVAAPPPLRSYSTGKFALELDGNHAGFVSAAEGGLAFGDVVKEAGDYFFFKKHLGNAGYRDIRLEFGADMDPSVYNWIALALQGEHVTLSGAIVGVNFNNDVISRLEFQRAQITEVTFPAMDATSKDAARLSIVLSPEQTVLNRKASGKLNAKATKTQKRWLSSGFRLSIDGVDATRVSKIDAMTVKLPRATFGECYSCENLPPPALVDFPDVVVTVTEPADSFYDWFETFVIKGNNGDGQEKGGTLAYLAPDMTTLFSIKLSNLGIFSVMPEGNGAAGDSIQRLLAAMYCESMEFVTQ